MGGEVIKDSNLNVVDLIPDGLQNLVKGYSAYAKEVVLERAIPGIDGFKPSQRRILYTMKFLEKVKDNTKCNSVCGSVSKLHPHGEMAVYATLVRMVGSSEYMNIPFVSGKGYFGKSYLNEPPAASRYTECMFSAIADELFGEMDGVDLIPSYDSKLHEPVLLPVSFPSILCNATHGIAVGVASNIPSFNFNEVNNAVIEYIETGGIKKPLMPDFITGGYYVRDDKELCKLMETGRARIKLRGKWYVEGKSIIIEELPYYIKVNDIMNDIADIQGIVNVKDETDKNGLRIAINCASKKIVESVVTEVLRLSRLQVGMMSNIAIISDNKPRVIGVKEVIKVWVDFRKSVLEKTLKKELDRVSNSIDNYEVLVDLLSNQDNRKKFVDLLMDSEHAAVLFLRGIYPDCQSFDWILGMSLKSLSNVAAKVRHLEGLKNRHREIEADLKDLNQVIVRQLKELNARYRFDRKTEITDEDFVFEKSNVVVKAQPTSAVVSINDKFIKKMRHNIIAEKIEGAILCKSNDVISFVDNKGRLLRVNLDNIDFVSEYDRGLYIPNYLEVADDFEIVCYELVSEKKVGYIYSDGFASVVDYSEWVDSQRVTRVTENGVSEKAGLIIGEIDFSKNYMMLLTKQGRFGFVETGFKQKHRTARTRIVNIKSNDEIKFVIGVDYADIVNLVSSPKRYIGKLVFVARGDNFNNSLFDDLVINNIK